MKFLYVLILIYCACCFDAVRSDEGFQPEGESVNELPDVSIADGNNPIVEMFLPTDNNFTFTNMSELSEFDIKASDIVNNSANVTKDEEGIAGLTQSERSGTRRRVSSRYKNGRQQVSIGDLKLSDAVPRHGALMHKLSNKFDTDKVHNSAKDNKGADSSMGLDANENSFKKKRRIPTSSATPSVQIVILVIGAVLGCVLLTGFIRWRVRGRLNASKQKDMSDDFVTYKDGTDYEENSDMDTIYECECEEDQAMLHPSAVLESEMSDEEEGLKFDDLPCSHRFDKPFSLMSHTVSAGQHARLLRPKSPKSGRDLGLVRGAKRHSVSRRKHGNQGRYNRHRRKRLENMFIQKLETIPMENSSHVNEASKGINGSTSLSRQAGMNGNRESTSEQQPSPTSSQRSLASRPNTPPPFRGALASLLNTWRSLSFNRDWVGRIWQEQHNVRRISDVLRGLATPRGTGSGHTSDTESNTGRGSLSSSAESLEAGQRSCVASTQDSVCNISETGANVGLVTVLLEAGTSNEQSLVIDGNSLAAGGTDLDGGSSTTNTDTYISATNCPQMSHSDHFYSPWSFGNLHEEPPEYESLLETERHSRNMASMNSIDHPRYLRRHRRKCLETRHRVNIHFNNSNSRTDSDLNHTETSNTTFTRDCDDESSPLTLSHGNHNEPAVPNIDTAESDTSSTATPTSQTDTSQVDEQSTSVSLYPNSPINVTPLVVSYVTQERVVIEQLSDGAQIVYIPPPALPSYHNDTPPPYQQ